MFLTFSKLTVVMEDSDGSGGNDLIDEFTVALSLSGAYNVTLTGKEQLATIALSYQIHCMNLPDCPTPSLSPTSKYHTCTMHTLYTSIQFQLWFLLFPFSVILLLTVIVYLAKAIFFSSLHSHYRCLNKFSRM